MKQLLSRYVPAVLFVGAIVGVMLFPQPTEYLKQYMAEDSMLGYVTFVSLLVTATVLMPLMVMPIIPVASAVLGPLPTALLSIVGWTVGGVIAFYIARSLGRPIIERFFSMEKIDSIVESMPTKYRFFTIVLLRLTIPVDVASYALGLVRSIGILEYTIATAIGVSWFSFAFSYLGDAFLTGNKTLLIELGAASLLIFIVGWYMLRRTTLKR